MDEELGQIQAFRRLSPLLASSGQPEPGGIAAIGRAGFKQLINLAMPTSPGALADEGVLAERAGLRYLHLPIDFDAPELEQAARLFAALQGSAREPVFVHCAKNMRVSALLSAYRMVLGGVPCRAARADVHAIWQPNEVWRRYVSNAALGAISRPARFETERLVLREEQAEPGCRAFELAIVDKASSNVVGSAGLRVGDSGTLDAVLARPKWAQSIAAEAGAKLLEVAFGWLGLDRVWASIDADDSASRRALEALGLRPSARFVQNERGLGRHRYTLVCALTAAEYWAT